MLSLVLRLRALSVQIFTSFLHQFGNLRNVEEKEKRSKELYVRSEFFFERETEETFEKVETSRG